MWSQGKGEPVESYLSKKPLRYLIMLRERNYFFSLFQKCRTKKKKKNPNLSNHCKGSYCWLFNTSSLLKPTTSVDEPASHFTEKGKETKENFHLFPLPSQPTYLDGWSLLLGKASLFMEHSLTLRLCSRNFCHPLHHQFCYCYGTLWVISINTRHTNM